MESVNEWNLLLQNYTKLVEWIEFGSCMSNRTSILHEDQLQVSDFPQTTHRAQESAGLHYLKYTTH